MRYVVLVLGILILLLWGGLRIYNYVVFGIDCEGHIKRAADANTIELAKQEMTVVVRYLEERGFTSGYTSVLYRTPDEDIGFWYSNLKASLGELDKIGSDASQLEKSNVLIKLRETLLDHDGSLSVTCPEGMSIYPGNAAYFFAGILGLVLLVGGIIAIAAIDG